MIALLDVNMLIALFDATHVDHLRLVKCQGQG